MPHPTSARLPVALALLGLALLLGPGRAAAQDDEGLDDEDFGPIAPKAPPKKGGKDPKKEGGAPAPSEGDDEDPEWDAPREAAPRASEGFDGDPDFDDPELAPPPKPKPAAAATAPKPAAASGPPAIRLDTAGKKPLGDHYPAAVVGKDVDSVVIELPLLIAAKTGDVTADGWVGAEAFLAGKKVAETRVFVSKAGVADLGPTFAWLKVQVPVSEQSGTVELRLSKIAGAGAAEPLFTKAVPYKM
ncbi:MAG: hypothetical protein JNM72_10170 [Deltaproteobacteria bacterium]|nr:hypothetical protein [Deltaproteobacteria bacterium]